MAGYQKMYLALFNAITDAINILQKSQQDAEEMYISADQANIMVMGASDADSNGEDKI